jgi:hypothetical protein
MLKQIDQTCEAVGIWPDMHLPVTLIFTSDIPVP